MAEFDFAGSNHRASGLRHNLPPARRYVGLDQYPVDPPAVHFDDPKTPSIPGKLFSGLGHMTELRQHEACERHEIADRQLAEAFRSVISRIGIAASIRNEPFE